MKLMHDKVGKQNLLSGFFAAISLPPYKSCTLKKALRSTFAGKIRRKFFSFPPLFANFAA